MTGSKFNDVWLWQVFVTIASGSWEAYPNDKGCSNHKLMAQLWGAQLSGKLKYSIFKCRVIMESVYELLVKYFSSDAVLAAESSKLNKFRRVVNKRQSMKQGKIDHVDNCPWFNMSLGIL